ncbi:uncharacterized protein LOC135693216 [Rhopilema esculentum]|uniref:uncharacterized protein LOC135693216 n=1 Tax=Rhopilema esculentum TaxID=499914 RepID=UPI0031D6BEFF
MVEEDSVEKKMEFTSLDEQEEDCQKPEIEIFEGPMAVITQGGNELMHSYNNVTQNLLRKVCILHEKLQDKDKELSRLTTENERLLERIHELLVGAELREEAKENKAKASYCNRRKGIIQLEIHEAGSLRSKASFQQGQSYLIGWLKVSCLLGLTIGTTVYLKKELEF